MYKHINGLAPYRNRHEERAGLKRARTEYKKLRRYARQGSKRAQALLDGIQERVAAQEALMAQHAEGQYPPEKEEDR